MFPAIVSTADRNFIAIPSNSKYLIFQRKTTTTNLFTLGISAYAKTKLTCREKKTTRQKKYLIQQQKSPKNWIGMFTEKKNADKQTQKNSETNREGKKKANTNVKMYICTNFNI